MQSNVALTEQAGTKVREQTPLNPRRHSFFDYHNKSITRQAMYVEGNIDWGGGVNRCYSGYSISITFSECVSVALNMPACNAHAPYCHLWAIRLYRIFSHYLTKGRRVEKVIQYKMCVLIFSTTFFFMCCWPCILVIFDFVFQLNALVYYIFSYSSTCFEPHCAHHQEGLLYIHSIWFFMSLWK